MSVTGVFSAIVIGLIVFLFGPAIVLVFVDAFQNWQALL